MVGRVRQVSVSDGGVPKAPVAEAAVGIDGVSGDRQRDLKHHGGPRRAVCMFSWEVIERLRAQGHPIAPGTTGENLTVEGIEWSRIGPGVRFIFDGGVQLEITGYTEPCANIRESFSELAFRRIKQDLHPGESRVYARVLSEGVVRAGENFRVVEEPGPVAGPDAPGHTMHP